MKFFGSKHISGNKGLPPTLLVFCSFTLGMFIATLVHQQSDSGAAGSSSRFSANAMTSSQPPGDLPLFDLGGTIYTPARLPPEPGGVFRAGWRAAVQDYQQELLKTAILVVKSRGEDFPEYRQMIADSVVSAADVRRFYEQNSASMDRPLAELASGIRSALERDRRQRQEKALIAGLVREGRLTFAGQTVGVEDTDANPLY